MVRRRVLLRRIKRAEVKLGAVIPNVAVGGIAGEIACGPPCALAGAALGARVGLLEGRLISKRFINGKKRKR